jgi:signal transduction histidine kinase
MGVLTNASSILLAPVAGLVYHLLLLLAIEAALVMALGEWRRTRRDQAQRLFLAMVGLTLARSVYLAAGLLTSIGWGEGAVLFPPLERFADTASICLLGWAFMPPSQRGARTWELVFGANLVLSVGAAIGFTFLWGQTVAVVGLIADYGNSWQAIVWGVWQMALIVLASVAVVRSGEEGWGLFLGAMIALFVGRFLQLVWPASTPHFSLWERLSNLVAYPLIAAAVYQNIVVRLRFQSRHLQDISQASLDQIKSLLYLFEASQQMSASLDLSMVLDNAVRGIARALDADECAIAFPEEGDAGQMRLVAIHNPARQGRGEGVSFPLDYQLTVQQAMRRRKYAIVEESDNIQLKVLFALLGSSEVGPLLVQPLVGQGESIGAVIVGNARSRRPFTPNEAKLCQSMAEQVVGAIRNAWRYQEAQARIAKQNKEVSESARALGQAKDRIEKLTERLADAQAELEELREREERTREARNALEIKLVSRRAEVDTLADRLAVLESDLNQAHANAEAQLRWHEEELARRQAAWELEARAAEGLQTVIQGMTAGVLITDAKGLIQDSNVAADILLERESNGLQGLALEEISDDRRWRQAVATASGGEAVRLTTQVGANTLMCDVTPLESDSSPGQVQGLVAILLDISTEAEAQRGQLEAVSAIARDLRTPMTSVINYVDLLLSEAVGTIGEMQRRFLLRVKAAAERMIEMINDLSHEAGGEEQWTSPQRQVMDVGPFIERIVAGSAIQLEDRAISLALDLPDGLPAIEADPDYLRRVLGNLLSNACLASAEGGQIRVWATQSNGIPFEPEQLGMYDDGYVIVSIKDAGGGLTDDALSRVFDRARPSQTPPGLGESGAGLALVKTLVEAHGGRLWVESEDGVGTTFSFVLPVSEQATHQPVGQPVAEPVRSRTG